MTGDGHARAVADEWMRRYEGFLYSEPARQALTGAIATALREARRDADAEHEALATVWRTLVGAITEWTVDIDAERLLDVAVAAGLYERVLYDPAVHGEDVDAEPGDDMIYVLTPLGRRLAAPSVTAEEERDG